MVRRLAPLVLVLVAPLLGGASCPSKREDCRHSSSERCLWERGVAGGGAGGIAEAGADGDGFGDGNLGDSDRTDLERTLDDMIEIMRAGLEWALVDERARALCRTYDDQGQFVDAPVSLADEAGGAWTCPVAGLEVDGQDLTLEAGSGVISLSSIDLDAETSDRVLELLRARFDGLCQGGFEELETAKLEVFHRCPLAEGPYLVVARFPQDLEAGTWQVSIAVVDAG